MRSCAERAGGRGSSGKLIRLRARRGRAQARIVLFNFPPNSGATGTAAYLSVFRSLLTR